MKALNNTRVASREADPFNVHLDAASISSDGVTFKVNGQRSSLKWLMKSVKWLSLHSSDEEEAKIDSKRNSENRRSSRILQLQRMPNLLLLSSLDFSPSPKFSFFVQIAWSL